MYQSSNPPDGYLTGSALHWGTVMEVPPDTLLSFLFLLSLLPLSTPTSYMIIAIITVWGRR